MLITDDYSSLLRSERSSSTKSKQELFAEMNIPILVINESSDESNEISTPDRTQPNKMIIKGNWHNDKPEEKKKRAERKIFRQRRINW